LGERIEREGMGRGIAEKSPRKSGEKAEKKNWDTSLFFHPNSNFMLELHHHDVVGITGD
jgi:hypothetical protein